MLQARQAVAHDMERPTQHGQTDEEYAKKLTEEQEQLAWCETGSQSRW